MLKLGEFLFNPQRDLFNPLPDNSFTKEFKNKFLPGLKNEIRNFVVDTVLNSPFKK